MGVSFLVNSAMTAHEGVGLLTKSVKSQMQWFTIGWGVYLFFVGMDYRKLQSWAWVLYGFSLLLLMGLFLTTPIQNVHRWYRIPFIGREFQPSECAKLAVIIMLSHLLEKKERAVSYWSTALQGLVVVTIPFFLILKQPDLGTALVLYPITLVMFYLGNVNKKVVKGMTLVGMAVLLVVGLIFADIVSYEQFRPYAIKCLKEYQYERLNPHTYHQKAAQTAIGVGGITGSGWHESTFSGHKWLPFAHTDSAFASYAEEFGLIGVVLLILFFFSLIYFSFQVTAKAKDPFGQLLSAGITVYLATHIIMNIGMMCGFLPITGVPLLLITYGGSSVVSTMMALGILQSIYSRRFVF